MAEDYYQRHIFFCINQKKEGKKCCASADAADIAQYARKRLKELDLFGPNKIRVSESGCLGRCSGGPCVVIYPEQTWYRYDDSDDIDKIIEHDIINKQVVSELLIPSDNS